MATTKPIKMTVKFLWHQKRVLDAADRAKVRVLKRSGAIVRGIARRSIRKRKRKKSNPGDPPFSHVSSSEFGIRTILFSYDRKNDSVIIGPLGKSDLFAVPGALEHGGPSMTYLTGGGGKRIKSLIKARPFMRPALDVFKNQYPEMWRDAIG